MLREELISKMSLKEIQANMENYKANYQILINSLNFTRKFSHIQKIMVLIKTQPNSLKLNQI